MQKASVPNFSVFQLNKEKFKQKSVNPHIIRNNKDNSGQTNSEFGSYLNSPQHYITIYQVHLQWTPSIQKEKIQGKIGGLTKNYGINIIILKDPFGDCRESNNRILLFGKLKMMSRVNYNECETVSKICSMLTIQKSD